MTSTKKSTQTSKNMKLGRKVFALGTLGLMAGSLATAAFAADDSQFEDMQKNVEMNKPAMFMQDEAILDAIDMADYDAFLEALENIDAQALEFVDEEKFEEIVERHAVHEEIKSAIESQDYESWKNAVIDLPNGETLIQAIDESEFETLLEMQNLREAGDKETAKELAQEIGLPEMKQEIKEGFKDNMQERMQERRSEQKQGIKEAVEAQDFDAFQEAVAEISANNENANEDGPLNIFADFGEEDFEKLTQIHEAKESGDKETAQALSEELGLPNKAETFSAKAEKVTRNSESFDSMQEKRGEMREEGTQRFQKVRGMFNRFFK